MNDKLYIFGIHVLVFVYIIVNMLYKKYFNIVLFGALFIVINLILRNYINSIIISYIIAIIYGIYKNFYLLENFKVDKEIEIDEEDNNVDDPELLEDSLEYEPIEKMKLNKDMVNIELKDFDIKSLISDELLDLFIKELKRDHVSIIYNKKVELEHLQPTLKQLNNKKILRMKNSMETYKLDNPIIISKDNFIVDGHHRWYSKRVLLNENKTDIKINTIMINLDINTIISKIKKFKFRYNKSQVDKLPIDNKRFMNITETLVKLKKNVGELELYFKDLSELKLV